MTIDPVVLVRLFVLAVALALALMAAMAWKRRNLAPEATIIALLATSAAIYCFGYSQEVAQSSLAGVSFWNHVEYLGAPWIPSLWVLLARKHNRLHTPLSLLLIIPSITLAGEWSDAWLGLYNASFSIQPRGAFWLETVRRGPISWLYLVYLYWALSYGAWLYVSRFRSSPRLFRVQTGLFVASSLVPLSGYSVYLLGWSYWGLDLAPVALSISIILVYIAVFKLEGFDLVPRARSLVFNNMRDAVLVTDLQHRLVDFNPAARELLPSLAMARLGNDIAAALPATPALVQALGDPTSAKQIELRVGAKTEYFELRGFALKVEELQLGWAVILANVTAQHQLVRDLRRKAETDVLTGAANRRGFVAAIEREIARSLRHPSCFSVIFADLDHLKGINDSFGHEAGDRVLLSLARRIALCLRASDLLSRYGGDEFAILLPETEIEDAMEVARRIRMAVASDAVDVGNESIGVSISIGVTTHQRTQTEDWRQLLDRADQALYRAKAEGRNRIVQWSEQSV